MTPHSLSISLENTADMLAEALWEAREWKDKHYAPSGYYMDAHVDDDTRKAIRRTIETLNMILEGDIRSPQDMAAEVEGRVSG